MAESSRNDLASDQKVQAFIEEMKNVVRLCKEGKNVPLEMDGYSVGFNPETKTYSVYLKNTAFLIATADVDENIRIDFEAPQNIRYYMKMEPWFVKLAKSRGKVFEPPKNMPNDQELEAYLQSEKQRDRKQDELNNQGGDKDNKEKPKDKGQQGKDQQVDRQVIDNAPANAIQIPLDTKVGLRDTIRTKLERKFLAELQHAIGIEIAPDANDRNNFSIYAVKADNKRVKLNSNYNIVGKNARNSKVLVYNKDGKNIEEKQPMQIIMLDDDQGNEMGFAIFGNGVMDREITTVARTRGGNFYGQVVAKSKNKDELNVGTPEVRAGTDITTAEQVSEGDREQEFASLLNRLGKDQHVPDAVNPEKDKDGIEAKEIEEPGGLDNIKQKFKKDLIEKFGLTKEGADYMTKQVIDEEQDFYEVLEKTIDIDKKLEELQTREAAGTEFPGSATWENAKNIIEKEEKTGSGAEIEPDEPEHFPKL